MEFNLNDRVINKNDAWDKIFTYEITKISSIGLTISINEKYNKNRKQILINNKNDLLIYPFSIYTRSRYEDVALMMERVADLVGAMLYKSNSMSLNEIIKSIMQHKDRYEIKIDEDIDWILRCLTAASVIVATCKGGLFYFSLSPSRITREKGRIFSASIASELINLSDRIRNIIGHAPTVGTYRENILQNTLRKHLPERYHVATGFIFGLSRQIDILVYDKIDYSPLFREGDLVVIPSESVRAVIEVKTSLDSKNLISALDLLQSASKLDDNNPPFFRGIFSFESQLSEDSINEKISDYYSDENTISQGGPGDLICRPFQHLTCACVINKSFSYISYSRNKKKRLVPILYSQGSAAGLESQASLFMQSLLSYLKFGGIKSLKINYMKRLLGEDTFSRKIKELRDDREGWGAYYAYDHGDVDLDVVEEMENLIFSVKNWIDGEENSKEFPYP